MRPPDQALAERLQDHLHSFDRRFHPLPGISDVRARNALIEQLVESIRRIRYIEVIRGIKIDERRADPRSEIFDPIRASVFHHRRDDIEEAIWLVFLLVHFGRHSRAGWRYVREVYGGIDSDDRWTWERTSGDVANFKVSLSRYCDIVRTSTEPRGFGNHRKYESLDAFSPAGTGAIVESYIAWVGPSRSQRVLIEQECQMANGDRRIAFDHLYRSMRVVLRFGRTARFDYLTMLGNLAFAAIEPGLPYLQGATGPLSGARLLWTGNIAGTLGPTELNQLLVELGEHLGVGMQVLEDALCNWQKNPQRFKPFRS